MPCEVGGGINRCSAIRVITLTRPKTGLIKGTAVRRNEGFTLIELMVVILIVAILAGVSVPMLRGRIDSAKWTEGKAIMGVIAASIRAHVAEKGAAYSKKPSMSQLGFSDSDLAGTYFKPENFTWSVSAYDPVAFRITAKAPDGVGNPQLLTLDQNGTFSEGLSTESAVAISR